MCQKNPSATVLIIMPRPRLSYLFAGIIFFFVASSAAAEVVYVIDSLRLGVRANPVPSETPIAVVTTGDALTVLGSEGEYTKIRTEDGTEGWVSQAYVSAEQPARLKLEQLQKKYARTEEQMNELRSTLAASTESREAMEKRISDLMAANTSLQQQNEQLTSSAARLKRKYAWVYQSAILIMLFVAGFYLGVVWYKRRVRDRLGGMEI